MDINLPEIKEYEISTGRRMVSSLYLLGTLAIFILLLAALFEINYSTSPLALVLILPGLAMTGFASYALVEDVSGRLLIDANRLTYHNIFGNHELLFSDIGGFRTYKSGSYSSPGKVIIILPKDKSRAKITMSQYLENQSVLVTWLATHFPNTDVMEHVQDEKSILKDPKFGENPAERSKNLSQAQNIAIGVSVLGCIAGGYFIFFKPYPILLFLAIAYVPLSFLAAPLTKGLIYVNNKTNSAHPFIGLGIIICSIGILVRALFDYDLLFYSQPRIWIGTALLSIVICALMLKATAEFNKRTSMDIGNVVALWLFFFLYSLGTYIITNCEMDKSEVQSFTTIVIDKRLSKGSNNTDFYLKIKPVGPIADEEISVPEEMYHANQINDKVDLFVRRGRWGTPWLYFK